VNYLPKLRGRLFWLTGSEKRLDFQAQSFSGEVKSPNVHPPSLNVQAPRMNVQARKTNVDALRTNVQPWKTNVQAQRMNF
jgi:hypothetical protein